MLVEDAIAGGTSTYLGPAEAVAAIQCAGRAFRAVGAVTEDDVDAMVALTELALFVRGAEWLAVAFRDLPTAPRPARRGALRSVTATDVALVELWEHAVVVHTTSGDFYELEGDVPGAHDWMEIRTNDALVSVDLSTGTRARAVEVDRRPVSWTDLALVWACLAMPAALAHEHDPRTPVVVPFEPLAVTSPELTITAIERSELLHCRADRLPAVAWIVSPLGLHRVVDQFVIDPPVPPPPAPIRLVAVDRGWVTEMVLRP